MKHAFKPLPSGVYQCAFCREIITELNKPETDEDWTCKTVRRWPRPDHLHEPTKMIGGMERDGARNGAY